MLSTNKGLFSHQTYLASIATSTLCFYQDPDIVVFNWCRLSISSNFRRVVHWSSVGIRAVICQPPKSSCTFRMALQSSRSTSHGIWNGCSSVPSIAALTNRVCFPNSREFASPGQWVVVQHRFRRHSSAFTNFCL